MLDARQHQGKFGEDYVRVLASAAGLVVTKEDIDADGVDLGLKSVAGRARTYSPTIEAQVKTWSTPSVSAGYLNYRGLDEWQFNRLAGPNFSIRRYLFLITVPAESHLYASSLTDGVLLRHLGYYLSLETEQPIAAPDRSRKRAVRVPIANVLTAATLRRLTETELDR
ncbi:DUF4365 domain-containing protein [Actinoplanes sp. TRM 88003]|uniref:DUF4365 domain-containing protein n=1 Tax=Paractinoplanes aksuensis TaxID=2939490 RepID=A0ABT1E487_9ACTN|nr:DUF4365 domain-containing protein [Actinoplanes aksuensis]MCO8277071.1 DUF4365 domain-containing protein [Actinoplanes aksuensis]